MVFDVARNGGNFPGIVGGDFVFQILRNMYLSKNIVLCMPAIYRAGGGVIS